MQTKPSTFGQVLTWVSKRLQQVERNMGTNPQSDPGIVNRVSQARSAIDGLISQDSKLKSEYIKFAEAEYAALANSIQTEHKSMTDEIDKLAEEIRNS